MTQLDKKLSYRRGTARRAVSASVETFDNRCTAVLRQIAFVKSLTIGE